DHPSGSGTTGKGARPGHLEERTVSQALVEVEELRAVLNLSDNPLYDADLYDRVAEAASELLLPYLLPDTDYTDVAPVREAALAIAVELWQHRVAPGGQMTAADFSPGPWRLGRSMLSRVSGLVAPWLDTDGMVG
ncbi:MAG: hypothetical protein ACLFUG_11435, partial [Nitriliruptoraceae bacterium]